MAAAYVGARLRSIRRRTIDHLGAVPIAPGELPRLENLLSELAVATGTPPVHAALVADPAPNALAVGYRPGQTTIVVTSGVMETFARDELEAVLAVEMSAVRRLDTALHSVALACSAGAIALHRHFRGGWKDPRSWVGIALTWPSMAGAELVRRWALRAGDFGVDEMAMSITRHPAALGRALAKLRDNPLEVEMVSGWTTPLWFEPAPWGDEERAREFRRLPLRPSLEERMARLPTVETPYR